MDNLIDVIIIGAGPAGMSSALYTSRANLSTLMIEKECPGGKMLKTKVIENYLGGSSNNALDLASNMFSQSIKFGAKYKQGNVIGVENFDNYKEVKLSNGEIYRCKALILAIGGRIANNSFKYDKYLNKGLSYCVICDATFYKGKDVAIIGDDRVIDDVDYLANIANKVYFINKNGGKSNKNNVENFNNINSYQINGVEKVESIVINEKEYRIDGVFYIDDSNSFNGFIKELELENGYIKVNSNMTTNIDGVFACGDITNKMVKQVITACGDGAHAALEAIKYINKLK